MKKEGRAEWIGKGEEKSVCWIWWRNAEEWAGVIATWVSCLFCILQIDIMLIVVMQVEETGQKNTVLTLYELTESDATTGQGM